MVRDTCSISLKDMRRTSNKTWPLMFFLHGYGDRGDNLFLLPKASPFLFIREKGAVTLHNRCAIAEPKSYTFP